MNTPTHIVAGLWLCGSRARAWKPVCAGALLPDLPLYIFYAVERLWRGRAEAELWSSAYFAPEWQLFFDAFNSLPLAAAGLLAAQFLRAPRRTWWHFFWCSFALHCVADLATHAGDAHRHFLPFSHWRFESPLSYWDAAHYGAWFMPLEAAAGIFGAALLLRRREAPGVRRLGAALLALYAALLFLAAFVWRAL